MPKKIEKISEQIQKELNIVNSTVIGINPDYAPSYNALIELIDLYNNSRYRDNLEDEEGYKKWFYNINDYRCKVSSKSIDLDTKDINLVAEDGQSYVPVWFLQKELKIWMKDNKWGSLLNRIKEELPRWGTVVLKKNKEGIDLVNLKNFKPEPTAKNLNKAEFILEEHIYSKGEFEDIANELGWKNIGEALHLFKDKEEITVYERYGRWNDEKMRSIVCFLNDKEVVLDEVETEDNPYKELHYDKRMGRWLGKGIVEELLENQTAINETVNFKRKSMLWSSKFLFQTSDEVVAAEMLDDMVNGRVIQSKTGINRIDMREQNLGAHQTEMEQWENNADRKTFTHDIMRGETLPSGTPLGSARLQAAEAGSFFEGIRENFGLFMKEVIFDWVLPDFKKEKNKEHILNFMGDSEEIEKFDKLVVNARAKKGLFNFIKNKGKLPTADQFELIKSLEAEKVKEDRTLKMPKGFYDNLKYKIDIVITGESINLASKLSTLQNALVMVSSNPAILTNPNTKKIFFKMLNLTGISPEDFEIEVDMPSLENFVATRGKKAVNTAKEVPAVVPQTQPTV